jgi:hypothetical protein
VDTSAKAYGNPMALSFQFNADKEIRMQRFIGSRIFGITGLLLASLTSACQPIPSMAEADTTPIIIEITGAGLTIPAELPAGVVTITYKNSSDGPAEPSLGWLQAGRTFTEFEQAMQTDDFPAILEMAVPLGGPQLAPGESEQITYALKAGDMLVVNFPVEAPPQIATTRAQERGQTIVAPVTAIKAELADFSFTIPDEMPAGAQMWQIRNVGEQWHHLLVLKLNEGATIADVLALTEEAPEGPLPFEEVAFYGDMGAGTTAWVTLDLPAGAYYVVCLMPNTQEEAMTPHLAHGMIRSLLVH